jgi:hypothetical protein
MGRTVGEAVNWLLRFSLSMRSVILLPRFSVASVFFFVALRPVVTNFPSIPLPPLRIVVDLSFHVPSRPPSTGTHLPHYLNTRTSLVFFSVLAILSICKSVRFLSVCVRLEE